MARDREERKRRRENRRAERQARESAQTIVLQFIDDAVSDDPDAGVDDILGDVLDRIKESFADRPFLLILVSMAELLVPLFFSGKL